MTVAAGRAQRVCRPATIQPNALAARFATFTHILPEFANRSGADREDLRFVEYVTLAQVFIGGQRRSG